MTFFFKVNCFKYLTDWGIKVWTRPGIELRITYFVCGRSYHTATIAEFINPLYKSEHRLAYNLLNHLLPV